MIKKIIVSTILSILLLIQIPTFADDSVFDRVSKAYQRWQNSLEYEDSVNKAERPFGNPNSYSGSHERLPERGEVIRDSSDRSPVLKD